MKLTNLETFFHFDLPIDYASNPLAIHQDTGDDHADIIVSKASQDAAREEMSQWDGYAPTPLITLPAVADELDIASLVYKNEASRFGLGSFKALGGAYAVLRVLEERLVARFPDRVITLKDIRSGTAYAKEVAAETVCAATDGNHGRAVAWGGQRFGCQCVIFVHERVSQGRIDAIASYGANVRVVKGNYDDAVREAARVSEENKWTVVSDTSYEGYVTIPRNVVTGYTLMVTEAIQQHHEMYDAAPTHVFVQGGVGALAGAVASALWEHYGAQRPRFCIVEPNKAPCLLESVRQGRPAVITGELDTIMAGLACGEVSLIAWKILEKAADDFMVIPDQAAIDAMRFLADSDLTPAIVAGESAVAGFAGCVLSRADQDLSEKMGLSSKSRVLVFGTEGATDPELYNEIVGRPAEEVAAV